MTHPDNASAAGSARRVLIAMLAVLAAFGFLLAYLDSRGIPEPRWLQLGSTFAFSALTFAWFWLDSESRGYQRSALLSIAIVALGLFAVPYYLLRSRPRGARLKALARFAGFAVLLVVAVVVGTVSAAWLGHY